MPVAVAQLANRAVSALFFWAHIAVFNVYYSQCVRNRRRGAENTMSAFLPQLGTSGAFEPVVSSCWRLVSPPLVRLLLQCNLLADCIVVVFVCTELTPAVNT